MIVLPFVGVLTYLIVQHDGMAERARERADVSHPQMDEYVRSVATQDGGAGEIEKAKRLLDSGTITQAEFETLKSKALAAH
jgi:hypothetical protein